MSLMTPTLRGVSVLWFQDKLGTASWVALLVFNTKANLL